MLISQRTFKNFEQALSQAERKAVLLVESITRKKAELARLKLLMQSYG